MIAADVSWLIVAAAIPLAGAALVVLRRPLLAMHLLLDLFLAAGLLRLSADASWPAIAVTASVVVLRQVLTRGQLVSRGLLTTPDDALAHRPARP